MIEVGDDRSIAAEVTPLSSVDLWTIEPLRSESRTIDIKCWPPARR